MSTKKIKNKADVYNIYDVVSWSQIIDFQDGRKYLYHESI